MRPSASRGTSANELPARIDVLSADDRRNRLGELEYNDRMAIVFALADVADDLVKSCVTPQMRQSYAAWVGLTVLQQLVRTKRFLWGDGPLGDGHSFRNAGSNVQMSRGTKAARQARMQANLLLNQVHGDGIIPCLQDMNFPYEIAAARQAL